MSTLVTSSPAVEGGVSDVRAFTANLKAFVLKFTPSTNYATNGDVIPAGAIPGGLKVADMLTMGVSGQVAPVGNPQLGVGATLYYFVLDYTNSKLKMFVASTGAEVAGAVNTQTVLGTSPIELVFLTR